MEKHLSWNEDDKNDLDVKDSRETKNSDGKERQPNPWGKPNRNRNNDGLPDLDEYFQKGQKWLKQMVGANNKSPFGSDSGRSGGEKPPATALFGMFF